MPEPATLPLRLSWATDHSERPVVWTQFMRRLMWGGGLFWLLVAVQLFLVLVGLLSLSLGITSYALAQLTLVCVLAVITWAAPAVLARRLIRRADTEDGAMRECLLDEEGFDWELPGSHFRVAWHETSFWYPNERGLVLYAKPRRLFAYVPRRSTTHDAEWDQLLSLVAGKARLRRQFALRG